MPVHATQQSSVPMSDGFILESKHFIWAACTSYLKGNISPENFAAWMSLLDEAYGYMLELVGHAPFNGAKIPIEATDEFRGAATWCGRILWGSYWMPIAMREKNAFNIAETRMTGWLILHELGHIFHMHDGLEQQWLFCAEVSASLKGLYVLERGNFSVPIRGSAASGGAMANRYFDYMVERYNAGDWVFTEDYLLYWGEILLLPFMRATNWEPLKLSFRYFLGNNDPPHFTVSEYVYQNNAIATMWNFFNKLAYFNNGKGPGNYMPSTMYTSLRTAYPSNTIRRIYIANREFAGRNFATVKIPYGVEAIHGWAFAGNTLLESITIPASVSFIDSHVFHECQSLREVFIHGRNVKFGEWVFWEGWENIEFSFRDNVIIHGHRNSDVELFARQQHLTFVSLDAPVQEIFTASSWARQGIADAVYLGLVPQPIQNNFTQPATRAEFAALAAALYENLRGEITGRVTFTDTNEESVQKMAYLGVVSGVGNNRFDPNGRITREQAAVMLSRLANALGQPFPRQAPTFADNASLSTWAVDGVGQAQAAGIMGGVGNNRFAPQQQFTREQSIVTMLRLFSPYL